MKKKGPLRPAGLLCWSKGLLSVGEDGIGVVARGSPLEMMDVHAHAHARIHSYISN